MISNNDSIYVLSNGSTDIFPENTLTNFKNKFPITLQQRRKKYQIAVQGIYMSQNFKNIISPSNSNEHSLLVFTKKDDEIPWKLENGKLVYSNEEINEIKKITFDDSNFTSIRNIEDVFYDINKFIFREIGTFYEYFSLKRNLLNISNTTTKPFYICCHPSFIKSFGIPTSKEIKKLPKVFKRYSFLESEIYKKIFVFENNYEYFYALEEDKPESTTSTLRYLPIFAVLNYDNCDYACFKIINKNTSWIRGVRNVLTRFTPQIIKINSPQIEEQIFDNEFSRDIVCFAPMLDNYHEQTFYYQEFKNKQYVTLENTTFDSLEIRLLDENNQPLELITDIATFIQFKIRRMPYSDEENISLHVSSRPKPGYETNKPYKFKIKLPQDIHIDQSFKLALTSINYPCNFITYPKDEYCIVAIRHTISETIPLTFTSNHIGLKLQNDINYALESLVCTINLFLKDILVGTAAFNGEKIKILIQTSYLKINGNEELTLLFSKSLLQILGYNEKLNFDDGYNFNKESYIKMRHLEENSNDIFRISNSHVLYDNKNYLPFHFASENTIDDQGVENEGNDVSLFFYNYPNLRYFHPKYLMVYLNILNPSLVGGEFLKILKVLPIKYSNTLFYIEEVENKDYITLQNNLLSILEFEIRGHDGQFISFPKDRHILLNLEITNKS